MKITDIKPNPNNPRFIKDDKFKKLVKSLEEDSWLMEGQPIILDNNNMILAGNMRYKALIELGHKDVPDNWIKKYDDLTEEQKKRAIIKTNVTGGEWDWDLIANEWDAAQLDDWGLDLPSYDNNITDNQEIDVNNLLDKDKTIICPKCKFEFEHEV